MIAQDPLALAEAFAAAEETASAVRHDLRNRLAAIRGATFYLQRRVSTTELWAGDARVSQFFAAIVEEVDKATDMLSSKMSTSHLTRAVSRTSAAASARAAAAYSRLGDREGVDIHLRADDGDVLVDRTDLVLAVRCLIENAAEAVTAGGVIIVLVQRKEPHMIIEVADTGPGFSCAERGLVTEPFFTTKPGHLGLGLSIAQRVCERYGGRLVIGTPRSGAAVALHVPLAMERAT
jgi:signal transduction histidine kinase